MAGDQPDHTAIIAEVARLGEQVRGVVKHLEAQDSVLEMLKTAHNVQVGKSLTIKLLGGTLLGGLGAGAVKLIEWLTSHNIPHFPPTGGPP